jgi:exopolyphosphatase / guanosine-5'-triphosphate,3'-diphosphate pyrophosphatase
MELLAADPSLTVTPDILHANRLTRSQIEARIAKLAAVPLTERRQIPGLEPDRADVIIAGAIVQARALARLNTDTILASARGLRYGLLYELLS